jgi:hypothetical protein
VVQDHVDARGAARRARDHRHRLADEARLLEAHLRRRRRQAVQEEDAALVGRRGLAGAVAQRDGADPLDGRRVLIVDLAGHAEGAGHAALGQHDGRRFHVGRRRGAAQSRQDDGADSADQGRRGPGAPWARPRQLIRFQAGLNPVVFIDGSSSDKM